MMFLRFALRSIFRRRTTAALLAFSLGIALGLPGAIRAVVTSFEEELTSRAAATPLVIGAQGSRADLVLHALYFRTEPPAEITVGDWHSLEEADLAVAAPLCVQATARGVPVVGTNGEYFRLRQLALAEGRPIERLGDCVLGSQVAEQLGLKPGDHLATDVDSLFNLGGGVPVRLNVTGIMSSTGSADDAAAFVSLETAWLISGRGHSHGSGEDATQKTGFIEINDENAATFHFHGNRDRFPLTAIVAAPHDEKSRLLLLGRYFDEDQVQLAEADRVLRELLVIALRLRRLFEVNSAVTALATLLLWGTVVALTVRLRQSEIRTMGRIGLSRSRIAGLFFAEFGLIAVAAAILAGGIALAATALAPMLFRWLVL